MNDNRLQPLRSIWDTLQSVSNGQLGWRRQRLTNQIDFAGCGLNRRHEAFSAARRSARSPVVEARVPWRTLARACRDGPRVAVDHLESREAGPGLGANVVCASRRRRPCGADQALSFSPTPTVAPRNWPPPSDSRSASSTSRDIALASFRAPSDADAEI